jgi:MFS family permease
VLGFLKAIPDPPVRRTLAIGVLDGITWAVMFGLAENFLVPFILLFGATVFEVSVLQGGAQLATGLGQLAGGSLIERGGSRRRNSLVVVVYYACSWLLTFWCTVITGSAVVAVAMYCASLFIANLASPGWMSWMNELVPANLRGRYWSVRNSIAGVVQLLAIGAAGVVLYQSKRLDWEMPAYGVLFTLACVTRLGGAVCIRAQYEPPMKRTAEGRQMTFVKFLGELRTSNFGRFVLFSVFLNFTVVMIYPIIQVRLLEDLRFDYLKYSAIMMTFTISSFVFMTYWGPLSDRFGNRRILVVSSVLLPFAALAWVFITDWKLLIVVQLISGFLVAGINLTTTNFIFDSVKPERMAKSVAYFTALNTGFAFLGALAGGALADTLKAGGWEWGLLGPLTTVFLVGAVLRLGVLGAFARGFREVRHTEPSPGLHYFFLYKPYQDTLWLLTAVPKSLVRTMKTTVRKLGRKK